MSFFLFLILRCIRPPQSQSGPIFWKHQCVLIDNNNFIKRIGSIKFILNHSGNFLLRTFLYFCGFFEFFHVGKPWFWIFLKKNFLVTQILIALLYKITFIGKTNKILLKISWNNKKKSFFVYLEKKTGFFSVLNWPPPNTIEHTKTFLAECIIIFY